MKTYLLALATAVTLPIGFSGNAFAESILGTGTGALLGGDLTDPENDGVEGLGDGSNFNWVSISASTEANFGGFGSNEASFDIFDNQVGGGNAKYCCGGAPWNVTVELDTQYRLTHFTMTSSNDSPGRDPDVWQIQGSNDGILWTDIYAADNNDLGADNSRLDADSSIWTARNQVIRFDDGGVDFNDPAYYNWFRLNVDSVAGWGAGGGEVALGELELFGDPIPEPTSAVIGLIGLGGLIARRRRA